MTDSTTERAQAKRGGRPRQAGSEANPSPEVDRSELPPEGETAETESLRRLALGLYDGACALNSVLKRTLTLADREWRTGPDIGFSKRLWAYRNGFASMAVSAFDFERHPSEAYLSQWQREKARKINGHQRIIHDDKLAFHYTLSPDYSDRLPELYGYFDDGTFVESPFVSYAAGSFPACVDRLETVVVKPRDRSHGANVRVVETTQDGYAITGESRYVVDSPSALSRQFSDGIVTAFVEQAAYAREIYPESANSIRIMTMIDPDTGEPFIATASHRFGTAQSKPVDNAAQGGLSTGIDVDTGTLEETLQFSRDGTRTRRYHPDTGTEIPGTRIPEWATIAAEIREMARYLAPLTPYIGWDVLVTDHDGSFRVLEANSAPDVIVQAHGPLLSDDRVVRFYEHHDVL